MMQTHQPDQDVFRSVLPEDIDWEPFPAFPPGKPGIRVSSWLPS
jgi:hypothetical protein